MPADPIVRPRSTLSRQAIAHKIDTLGRTEHVEIFRMFQAHSVPYTLNKNAVWMNITPVDDALLHQVSEFVSYCADNNKALDEYDQRLNRLKLYPTTDGAGPSESESFAVPAPHGGETRHRLLDALECAKTVVPTAESIARKGSSKFLTARKKYGRRLVADNPKSGGAGDAPSVADLHEEPFAD